MEGQENIIEFPHRQIERVNGIKLNLTAMSDLELQVLEAQVSDRFVEVHSELEVVRRALADRRPQEDRLA